MDFCISLRSWIGILATFIERELFSAIIDNARPQHMAGSTGNAFEHCAQPEIFITYQGSRFTCSGLGLYVSKQKYLQIYGWQRSMS
jgi:hypothetical protein